MKLLGAQFSCLDWKPSPPPISSVTLNQNFPSSGSSSANREIIAPISWIICEEMHIKGLTHGKRSDRVTVLVWDLPEQDPETGRECKVKVGRGGGRGPRQGGYLCGLVDLTPPRNSGSSAEMHLRVSLQEREGVGICIHQIPKVIRWAVPGGFNVLVFLAFLYLQGVKVNSRRQRKPAGKKGRSRGVLGKGHWHLLPCYRHCYSRPYPRALPRTL